MLFLQALDQVNVLLLGAFWCDLVVNDLLPGLPFRLAL